MSVFNQGHSTGSRKVSSTYKLFLLSTALTTGLSGFAVAATVNSGDSLNVASGDTFSDTTLTNNGIVDNRGTVDTTSTSNNGQFNNHTGATIDSTSVTNNAGGNLDNDGLIDATSVTNNAGGLLDNSGTIDATLVTNSGTGQSSGLIDANSLTNTGQFTNETGGIVDGNLNNNGGSFDNSGTVDGSTTNAAGAILNNNAGGTLDGTTTNSGVMTNAGTMENGTFNNSGTFTNNGSGNVNNATINNDAGSIENRGTFTNTTFNNDAGAEVTNRAAGSIAVTTYNNDGTTTNEGSLTGTTLNNNLGGTFTQMGGTLSFSSILNDAGATFNNYATTTGAFSNSGTANAMDGSTFDGTFTNNGSGVLNVAGAATVDGDLVNNGLVDMDSPGIDGTDSLAVTGNLSGAGTYNVDADLGGPIGAADTITVAGDASGSLTFNFDAGSPVYGLQLDPTLVLDVAGANSIVNADISYDGLPEGGLVVYGLVRLLDDNTTIDAAGDNLGILSQVNPAVGALASGLTLTQDLVNSVANRPTSPFVSSLATGEECSKGGWARVLAGSATLSGDNTNSFGGTTSTNSASIDADYRGIQGGFDFGCFDGRYSGWDLVGGLSLGYVEGETRQTQYNVLTDLDTGAAILDLSTPASITETDFDQRSVGLYLAAAKDQLTADFQLRYDDTRFDLTDTPLPGFEGLGLNDTPFDTETITASTRISYRIDLNAPGMVFVPTAGLSISETTSSTVRFDSGETLDVENYDTTLGYIGGTLAKTVVAPSGTAGTTYFASANYYNDFSGDRTVVFTDNFGTTSEIETTNLGDFGEISLGLNHVTILDGRSSLGAKQLNASIRLDTRFGDAIEDAYSITGQIRLSF